MFVVVIFLIRCDLFDTVFFFACTFWGRLWNYWFTEQLSTTGKSSVKEMSPYLKSLCARFYIVLQEMIYVFTRQNIFSQNAACLSAPLTVTSKSPIFKGHVCMLSTFFVKNSPPFSLVGQGLQGHAVYATWFSWKQSPGSILASQATGFSEGLMPSWTSSNLM